MAFRIGIDMGGTFTDLVVIDETGELRMYKSPTTPNDYTKGIINGLQLCADDNGMELKDWFRNNIETRIVLATTVATNTVLQWKGAKVGILCTKGHKYILHRRQGTKQDSFNFYMNYPRPLVRPYLCLEVNERVNSEGGIEIALDEESVRAAIRQFKEWNVEAIGICLLWSIANDAHERRVKKIIQEEWPDVFVSVSSEVQPIIQEYNRTSCVAFDAMLKPMMTDYAKNLRNTLAKYGFDREFLMVVSSGGVMSASEAVANPVHTLFSGPAMGPTAGLYFAKEEGIEDVVTVDMGGTSFDVSAIIGGVPTVTREGMVGEYPTGLASVEVLALGAGGGSIGWIDSGGLLRVGPQSAEADPGPACYGRGGEQPTVTDANVVLGYISPDYFLGGRMEIDPELSRNAIKEKIARSLKISCEEAALGIYRVVNENMVGGILEMTVRRGIDPREFLLVVGGGAGPIHAARIAKELAMKKLVIPKTAPVLCATGMLNADMTFSYVGSKYSETKRFDFEGVNNLLDRLEQNAKSALEREGIPADNRRFDYYVAARYPMQLTQIDIPLKGSRMTTKMMTQLEADFHAAHELRYAVCDPDSYIECTDWRVVGIGVMPKLVFKENIYSGKDASRAEKGRRSAYFEETGGFTDMPLYDADKLGFGMELDGPAIVESPLTTIVVIPGAKLIVNKMGNFVMELSV